MRSSREKCQRAQRSEAVVGIHAVNRTYLVSPPAGEPASKTQRPAARGATILNGEIGFNPPQVDRDATEREAA